VASFKYLNVQAAHFRIQYKTWIVITNHHTSHLSIVTDPFALAKFLQNLLLELRFLALSAKDFRLLGQSPLQVNRRFRRTCRLHLELARLILWSRWWMRHVPPKRRLTSNGPHGVIAQKIELFESAILFCVKGWFMATSWMLRSCFIIYAGAGTDHSVQRLAARSGTVPGRGRYSSFFLRVQTSSGTNPASYPMGTVSPRPGGRAAGALSLQSSSI
jgi:hypothetical protein